MTKESIRFRPWELAALAALCISLLWGMAAGREQQRLAAGLIRLHVLAESDSEAHQQAKLRARDAILVRLSPELEAIDDPQRAAETIQALLPELAALAGKAAGCKAEAALGWEEYPTREYEGFSLPAGRYLSLRILLGEAKGHNWWCVVFPPLCSPAVGSAQAVDALDGKSARLITGEAEGYVIRWRAMELWAALRRCFAD